MSEEKTSRLDQYISPLLLLCFILLIAQYSAFKPNNVTQDQTIWIQAELTSKPVYKEHNGDDAPYIYFKIKGYDKKVDIGGCALYRIDKEALLAVHQGDRLSLQVNAADLKSMSTPFVYSPIHVYGVKLKSGKAILSLDRFNRCENGQWRNYLLLSIAPILMLFWRLVDRWRKPKTS